MKHNITIRQLIIKDLDSFFDVRLESLQNSPINFATSYEEEKSKGYSFYQQLLNQDDIDNLIFGAFINDQLIGVTGIYREKHLKLKHKCNIWGMYVQPAHRKHGVAKALLNQAIEYAKNPLICQVINITVEASNISAKNLYESFGFKEWGLERRAMRLDGQYFDEFHMSLLIN